MVVCRPYMTLKVGEFGVAFLNAVRSASVNTNVYVPLLALPTVLFILAEPYCKYAVIEKPPAFEYVNDGFCSSLKLFALVIVAWRGIRSSVTLPFAVIDDTQTPAISACILKIVFILNDFVPSAL